MNILGLSGGIRSGNQDGAAALLVDGQLVAAVEEERLVGIKFANGLLPKHAIQFCLKQSGLSIQDIDLVVFVGATYDSFCEILSRFFVFHFGHAPKVVLVDHHTAHAASTYYGSGMDPAVIVTMDFSGDRKSTTVRVGQHGQMKVLAEIEKPDSLGIYYSAVTQYLGFQKDSDEYKVMGMAAYGQPRYDFSHILELTETGYRFHSDFIRGVKANEAAPSKQEPLFDSFPLHVPPRVPGTPLTQEHFDIAASAQHQLEQAVLQVVKHYTSLTGIRQVCLAGGVALNCLMAQQVRESDLVSRVYVPPGCSDAGLAIGAAYLEASHVGDKIGAIEHAYWGPEFSDEGIRFVLDRANATYRETDDPAEQAAQLIAEGKIVGWFQGRMEFGPRALGNRSILGNPQIASMKDTINQRVKFREEFRPFAPSVRHEDGALYFEQYKDSPYMTQTFTANERVRREAPAIVHADGTSRIQTVHVETNPLYHELITAVGAKTGLPMVLNTSLNAYGDPMACEPYQALRTYFTTGLDALVLGKYILEKTH